MQDLNKILNFYKKWRFELYPKLEIRYFIERVMKKGSEKSIKEFLEKLRKHYTQQEIWDDLKDKEPILNPEANPSALVDN